MRCEYYHLAIMQKSCGGNGLTRVDSFQMLFRELRLIFNKLYFLGAQKCQPSQIADCKQLTL